MDTERKHRIVEFSKTLNKMEQRPNSELGISQKYERSKYDYQKAHDKFKDKAFENKQGKINKTTIDENGKLVYRHKNDAIERFGTERYGADADHIDPLKSIHDRHKNNYFLNDSDIKKVGNRDSNFNLIRASENRSKQDSNDLWEGLREKNFKKASKGLRAQAETDLLLTQIATQRVGREFLDGSTSSIQASAGPLVLDYIDQISKGDRSIDEITVEMGKLMVDIAASGGCNKIVLQIVSSELKNSNNPVLSKIYSKGKVPELVAVSTNLISSASRYMSGDLNENEFIDEIGETGSHFLAGIVMGAAKKKIATYVGGEMGAIILGTSALSGPLFAAGMIVGSCISFYEGIKENYDAFNQQVNKTIKIVDDIIFVMQEVNNELEQSITNYYQNWDSTINDGFKDIFIGAQNNNFDSINNGLNKVLSLFEGSVVFNNIDQVKEALNGNFIIEL